ncbi:MAG: MaoC/PaaZ C-terminal domain-containing protein [Acidimicrobiia bacterium]
MTEPTIQLGKIAGPIETTIDGDHAAAYALATNDPNPAYLDGGIVPPVFTVSLGLPLLHEANQLGVPAGAVRGATGGVHGQHDLLLHRTLRAGDFVRVTGTMHGAYNTKGGAITTVRILVAGEDGEPYVEHLWSSFHIKGELDEVGPPLADHSFPEEARSASLGALVVPVERDQSFRYAGSSTDHAPMHVHDESARRVGFPSKFMQGLCTFAMCSRGVVQLGADGDPTRLRRMAARFASPVFPGNELEVSVYDAGRTVDGGRQLAFEAVSADKMVIRHGRAELHPA